MTILQAWPNLSQLLQEPSVQQLTTPGKGKNTLVILGIAAGLGRYGKYCGGSTTFKRAQADGAEILTYS